MKYVSIDIETTGLDPKNDQVLEFGAVIDDGTPIENLPTYHAILKWDRLTGQPFALQMNTEIIKIIANGGGTIEPYNLAEDFADWLIANGWEAGADGVVTFNVAGKCYAAFDNLFLEQLPNWTTHVKAFRRVIDPAMLYWRPDDTVLPSMLECLRRAGIEQSVGHRAVDDAITVIKLIRKAMT